ncbi:MAG: hypothetical protein VB076_11425 [Synergistaceae bacterium]|nr:hypothetical protein [Synergistaceae bacterium]
MPNIRSEDSGQIIVRLPERTRRALNIIVRHKNEKNPGAKFSANSVIRHVVESHISKYMQENPDVIDMILEDIRDRIKRGAFKGVSQNNLWGGADVGVLPKSKATKKQDSSESSFYGNSDILVISDYAQEISALFYELGETFFSKIDYYSKLEFYGRLAEAANRQIKVSDDLGVLLAMLDEIDKMRKEKFI